MTRAEKFRKITEQMESVASFLAKKYKVKAADKWMEDCPKECSICHKKFKPVDNFVDGKTKMGSWATMCEKCFKAKGMGLGVGFGQKYNCKTLEKVEEK